jgi:hypothetical protein
MPIFYIQDTSTTTPNSFFFNGFDNYAAGTRQNTPVIPSTLQGQSTVGARNILMASSLALRLAGGTFTPAGGTTSTRPWIGCFRVWNSTAPTSTGASAASLSASAQTNIPAYSGTTVPQTNLDITNVILSGNVTYLFGFNNALTGTSIWAGAERVTSAGQSIYQDTLTTPPNSAPFVLDTTSGANPGVLTAGASLMGYVTYFTIPPAPVISSITKLTNGVRINFDGDESNSGPTTGCIAYSSIDGITYTKVPTGVFAISGSAYTFTITSGLTLGLDYYFKITATNDVTDLDNTNNTTYNTRSLYSNIISQQFGNAYFVKVRTAGAWANAAINSRTVAGTWITEKTIKKQTAEGWVSNT